MNDDYLWDGSGEPDPDVEHLENLLGRYRSSQPAPRIPEPAAAPVAAPVVAPRRWTRWTAALAAAAAVVLMAVGAVTVWRGDRAVRQTGEVHNPAVPPTTTDASNRNSSTSTGKPGGTGEAPKTLKQNPRRIPRPGTQPRDQQASAPSQTPQAPAVRPLLDIATSLHLEQAEYLLRSFRNAEPGDDAAQTEIALDARQSRELLNQNVLLRRNAELRGNVPAEQILGDLEPFLVDIANLDARSSSDDVASIQNRIQKREIVADLQLYSSNRTSSGY